ncbi:hypothetical protein DKX38_026801 [Salix brachista]|uniref:Rab-GAP TBC domain-containing protein n=1 Tax=Salix brachista TaxID=2182728 RepID=A0A5N5JFN0_9ROSI|nr:hypothetical protein DKX38_026801 [Salix brachista]
MVKKKVPDWLNSSLWSSTTTTSSYTDRFDHHSSTSASPPIDPPTPPAATGDEQQNPPRHHRNYHPQKPDIREDKHSRSSIVNDNISNYSISNNKIDNRIADNNENSAEDNSKQALLLTELSRKVINMGELRRIASQGIPDGAGIRSTVWKLLLGYLPPDRSLWSSELVKKRSQYKRFKEELLMNPVSQIAEFLMPYLSEITRRLEKTTGFDNDGAKSESRCVLSRSKITHGEHPLSLGKSSIWNQFFQFGAFFREFENGK